ncbi:hypothetical protein [Actinomadura litoris]|uniref:hypothetical protein n=1 Tax=Actinomadura litoris TaxID=2678616 RepID=UPI001FA7BB1E|nr:hypothetical protein [Actinomadura litoris]
MATNTATYPEPRIPDLRDLTLAELADDKEAARIVARLTRTDTPKAEGAEPVRVAAFNSFI